MLYRKFQKLRDTQSDEDLIIVGTPHDHLVYGKRTEIYALRNSQNVTIVMNRELVESDRFTPVQD